MVDNTTPVMFEGHRLTFVPYVPNGRFIEALNVCPKWNESTFILAHQEFKGCKMGAVISVEGDEWLPENPLVISGHIHEYQSPQANIIYVGTPIQHSYGDKNDKAISLFTLIDGKPEETRIDLCLPRKYIIRLNCREVDEFFLPPDVDVKIIISGTSAELKSIQRHIKVKSWKEAGYKVVLRDIPVYKEENERGRYVDINFSRLLYNTVSSDEELKSLFHELFGAVKE